MTDQNKESAVSFLKLAAGGNVDEAYRKYVAVGFKHHNQFFEGSAESLKAGMKENALQNPNKVLEVKQIIAEGEYVVTLSHVRHKPGDPSAAVVHFFRFENGKIVELWDLGQPIQDNSPDQHGMF